jgi:hypothetical protein
MMIKIKMKLGGMMTVKASGHCVKDRSGSGEPLLYVEDLTCFWPGAGKAREISPSLYDNALAEEAYWLASEQSNKW